MSNEKRIKIYLGPNPSRQVRDAAVQFIEAFAKRPLGLSTIESEYYLDQRGYIAHCSSGRDGSNRSYWEGKTADVAIDLSPLSNYTEVELNDEYTAVINNGKVTVGCQTFTFDKVRELAAAVEDADK